MTLTIEQRIARHLTAKWHRLQRAEPNTSDPIITNVAHEIALDLFGTGGRTVDPAEPPERWTISNGQITVDNTTGGITVAGKWTVAAITYNPFRDATRITLAAHRTAPVVPEEIQ